ncbi:MAG: hypothetical protein O3B13_20625 [Planctomycetota bacterium]|nr:hypothetical protein [Planctomycetota bacterium]MDA1165509.1 hypothetical protein [Planctomycetota bacterium]
MRVSLPSNWALPFRSRDSRRRKLGRAKSGVAAEAVETRCLLSATTPLSEAVWAQDYVIEYDIDSATQESDYSFDWVPIGNGYGYDLTFDELAFIESDLGWDTSPSWLEGDYWLDNYEEIRDSFQAAIDGTFNGFIDSIWIEDRQSIEFIGDVIYLTLESASGMLVPVEVFVAGGNAETVLTSGASILQQVEQLLVAPENNLFDASSDLQVVDVAVNLFQYNDGTSDQLVIDSYEIFREDFSSPGFLESEFVLVNNFDHGTEFVLEELFLDTIGDEELLAITDLTAVAVDEITQDAIDASAAALDETIAAATESGAAGIEAEVESLIVSAERDPSLEQETPTESDLSVEMVREDGKLLSAAQRGHRIVTDRYNPELGDKQEARHTSRPDQSTIEHAVESGSDSDGQTNDVPSQTSDRWQRLRRQAALAAQQIASSGGSNQLSAFRHTGVVPATTGSLAMNWGATIAAFAHSALEDQLQGLTTADPDNEQSEDSAEQLTYAQIASATGTMLIGATAAFQAMRKRRQSKIKRRGDFAMSNGLKETRHKFSTVEIS